MLLAVVLIGMVLVQGCDNESPGAGVGEPWYIESFKKVSPEAKQEMTKSRGLYVECDNGAIVFIERHVR